MFISLFRRHGQPEELVELEEFFQPMIDRILIHFSRHERILMSALDDLNAKVDGLTTELSTANGKIDSLLAKEGDVAGQLTAANAQIAILLANAAANGTGVSADDLNLVGAKIDAALATVKGEEAKVDAALAPPAPAPTTPDPSAPAAPTA